MRIFKTGFTFKALGFFIIFFVLNRIASFFFLPVGAGSELMWYGFDNKKTIDTVFVGDSLCSNALNPAIFDEITGQNSFNMGTNSQSLTCSYLSIKNAIQYRQVKHVIFVINYQQLRGNIFGTPKSQAAFMDGLNRISNPRRQLHNYLDYISLGDNFTACTSINILLPWVYNHVDFDTQRIKNNIAAKYKGETALDNMNTKRHSYDLNGYKSMDIKIDYRKIKKAVSRPPSKRTANKYALQWLERICKLCQKNYVDLLVIYPPHPNFDVLYNGETHFKMMEQAKTCLSNYDVPFYDFSLSKPELLNIKDEHFRDREHMNRAGATAFSEAFALFWNKRKHKETLTPLFYTQDEFYAVIDTVSAFNFPDADVEKHQPNNS